MEEGWERSPRLELSSEQLLDWIEPAFPGASLVEHAVVPSGLANTHVRFRLHGHETEYVLRVHTRDPHAALRERELMRFLAQHPRPCIPVARLVYSDPAPRPGTPPYSVWDFVEGTLLQDLFRTLPDPELVRIAGRCGRVAAAIHAHVMPVCGEFGQQLAIHKVYGPPSQFVPETLHRALFTGLAGERLGTRLRDALWSAVKRACPLLDAIDGRYTLVHADFKRSNLLLQRASGSWHVAAVLDWEFACAGPPLLDVGLFLRAGEALPPGFREAFVAGYRAAGGELPDEWLRLSRLLDLLSQMTFLEDPRDRPKVIEETTQVVEETLRVLGPLG